MTNNNTCRHGTTYHEGSNSELVPNGEENRAFVLIWLELTSDAEKLAATPRQGETNGGRGRGKKQKTQQKRQIHANILPMGKTEY